MQNLWDFSHPSSYLWLWSPPSQSWCPSAQSTSCRHCLFPEVLGFRQTQEEIVFLPPWDPGEWGLCPSHSFCPCFGLPLLKFSVVSRTPVKSCFQDRWVNCKQLLCNAGGSFQPMTSCFTRWVLSLAGQETEVFALMGPIFWPHPWVPHLSFLLVVMFGRQECLLLKEIPILGRWRLWPCEFKRRQSQKMFYAFAINFLSVNLTWLESKLLFTFSCTLWVRLPFVVIIKDAESHLWEGGWQRVAWRMIQPHESWGTRELY